MPGANGTKIPSIQKVRTVTMWLDIFMDFCIYICYLQISDFGQDLVGFLIKCALRHRLIPIHFGKFVLHHATAAMVVPPNLCLDYVHSFSTSTSPILLYIDIKTVEGTLIIIVNWHLGIYLWLGSNI